MTLLTIRLARVGAKKKPYYRIVVIEKARAHNGRFLEVVGHYNPRKDPAEILLQPERIQYWIQQGAQPSETVRSFLRKQNQQVELTPEPVA
ncbi:MAG: 30S ribosomal protein S16 [Acidobacteria bacterium RIFCSPLOWO2_02_FULL_59_13]|nr:MAG: 30S ribosomal protein S16 [Acidobacteria bacterium RIFCSPLOWO2_02_FULL_59_13]